MSTTDADNHTTGRLYDGAGDLTGVVDPDTNLTQYLYDDQGRPTETIDPLGHASLSEYDAAGNVTLAVDAVGRTVATGYDADNRVVSETWTNADGSSAGGKTFTYDAAGDLLTASNGVGTYTFTYDGAGRVATVADPFGVTLALGYDAAGNRTSVADGSGGSVTSTFDPAGNLSTRSLSASGADATVTFGHDAAGRETGRSWTSGGASEGGTGTSYDGAGDVTGVTGTAGGVLVFGQTSGFDGAGRLGSVTTGGVTTTFGYDPAGQLTSAGVAGYSYDPNGVPTSGGLTPGADNQVASDGTWDYTYDAAGELTAKVLIAGGTSWGYGYDPAGELTSAVETVSGSVAVAVDYQYDAFGNLVGRTETDSGTVVSDVRYAVDGWDTAKPSPTGNENYDVYAVLTPTGSGGWAIAERQVFGAGFDQPLAGISAAGAVQWYVADRQGSVVGVFDNSGTSLATASYDAFGNITSGGVSGVTLYGFQGGAYDPATGYVNFGGGAGRWYDPAIEQWTKKDPLGLTPGPNASAFEGNGPGNGRDPSGRLIVIPNNNKSEWDKIAQAVSQTNPAFQFTYTDMGNGYSVVTVPQEARRKDTFFGIQHQLIFRGLNADDRHIATMELYGGYIEPDPNFRSTPYLLRFGAVQKVETVSSHDWRMAEATNKGSGGTTVDYGGTTGLIPEKGRVSYWGVPNGQGGVDVYTGAASRLQPMIGPGGSWLLSDAEQKELNKRAEGVYSGPAIVEPGGSARLQRGLTEGRIKAGVEYLKELDAEVWKRLDPEQQKIWEANARAYVSIQLNAPGGLESQDRAFRAQAYKEAVLDPQWQARWDAYFERKEQLDALMTVGFGKGSPASAGAKSAGRGGRRPGPSGTPAKSQLEIDWGSAGKAKGQLEIDWDSAGQGNKGAEAPGAETAPAPQRSGLRVVPRPGMTSRTVTAPNGRTLTVYGQAEASTSETPGHAEAMNNLAVRLAEAGEYEYVTLQRSWRTATGRVGTSENIPDVIGVRKNGTVDAWEVRSQSQTVKELEVKLNEGMSTLPANRQGNIKVIEPEPPTP